MKKKMLFLSFIILFCLTIALPILGVFSLNRIISGDNINSGKIKDLSIGFKYRSDDGYIDITNDNPVEGFSNQSITSFASKNNGTVYNYLMLNQILVNIRFKSDIDVKLRVKIQDEWLSYKNYSSGMIKEQIVSKEFDEVLLDNNPLNFFKIDDVEVWDYDYKTGYAYYNQIIKGNINGEENIIGLLDDSDYVYQTSNQVIGYKETIIVKLAFQVEIVQANRANKVWGIEE